MQPARFYFLSRFSSKENITHWPIHFAIFVLLSNAEEATGKQTKTNYAELVSYIKKNASWIRELTVTTSTAASEAQCLAVNFGWQQACDIAHQYGLKVIYFVSDNSLSLTYSDDRRKPLFVDGFLNRYMVDDNHTSKNI